MELLDCISTCLEQNQPKLTTLYQLWLHECLAMFTICTVSAHIYNKISLSLLHHISCGYMSVWLCLLYVLYQPMFTTESAYAYYTISAVVTRVSGYVYYMYCISPCLQQNQPMLTTPYQLWLQECLVMFIICTVSAHVYNFDSPWPLSLPRPHTFIPGKS